ncbi:MAG TPA: primosomal protein N', partial [Leptospiraceae bacterium]|nr:primosomal protein N' [Leptospiraceae bacterium]
KAIGREASENTFMLGPAECPFYRVDSNFRRHIILKTHDIQKIREILKKTVLPINLPSGLYLEIDIDPVDLV